MCVRVYLFGVEVMCKLSIRVVVAYTDCGPCLVPLYLCDTVIPQSSRYPLVREPSQDQSLVCDLHYQTLC